MEADSQAEDQEEAERLFSRRLSVTMRCYDKLMEYETHTAAAAIYRGDGPPPINGAYLSHQAVLHADLILKALGG